jgi:hypothetical protein
MRDSLGEAVSERIKGYYILSNLREQAYDAKLYDLFLATTAVMIKEGYLV